jgi:hypothetical protein
MAVWPLLLRKLANIMLPDRFECFITSTVLFPIMSLSTLILHNHLPILCALSGNDGVQGDRRVLVWDPARPGMPVIQLSCPVTTLATAPPGRPTPNLVIAHRGGGLSLWSFTG